MPVLDKITIKGFKSIKSMEGFELKPLNVLIGANGAGKSNFIGVFKLLNEIVQENLQVFIGKSGGADQLLHYGHKTTETIYIHLQFGKNAYECNLTAAGDSLIFEEENVYFHIADKYPAPYQKRLRTGYKESVLPERVGEREAIAEYVLAAMQGWKIYHFHDTGEAAKIKKLCDLNDNRMLRPDASNLAAYLYLLKEKKIQYYRNICDTIRLVAPFFGDFALRPSPLNPDKIKLEWTEKGSDAYFDANSLSDGTLRFIALATLLTQPNLPQTILLDEPELGLHPYAITVLAGMLKSAATKTQVIVSTQSVTLVNQLDPEDIIVVDRKDGQSTFKRPTKEEIEGWLDDYSLGELWEKNLIGGRPTP